MRGTYNLLTYVAKAALPLPAMFNPKLKLFVEGRKKVFKQLEKIDFSEDWVWFHAASLGEFEQAVPIMEAIKENYPTYKILVSFYSPSGYENKKKHPLADAIVYLPLDTPKNAKRFVSIIKPKLAFFIKYDIWPNFLKELQIQNIRTFLISGAFRKDQIYFKPYGGLFREALRVFEHIFLQNETSKELLKTINITNTTVSGDTRFDRVARQLEYDNQLDFVAQFKDQKTCIVAGSTWPEDDALLLEYINTASEDVKFIIAPHEIKNEKIQRLKAQIVKKTVLFSEKKDSKINQYQVLIIDTIGLLTKVYSYADIAYVGGAAGKSGLHNILEPATFGLPIIIGKNFDKFPEAKQLEKLAGLFSVASAEELFKIMTKMVKDEQFRSKTGMISGHFINSNTGATQSVLSYLKRNH
ncbi:3-deoxy-D-manno-octulosonic acid transferase [Zunongwangia profunda]|uniref:3-deoxy-D-manno-octulosonic acid transferase n=1 Tax=Zunongwangia profunda TaxID=398743 RepID=A0A3D5J5R3_9FLAO|nr:glycosyltransferase N-terminal domain-containing protein [Zunongwangia profunda]MAC63453.1 3-deoxy-D-manno-octulosonic acid transferase [Flavobacteriaceae bacterium]MAG86924.1 3-deoxy-D-manno-octulosonic acid transferase [Flavobacteriaceae bacterium]HAJ80833.1 3-deoxy-D-manno-octulosonic acid transferase [Zunongwangia profunda]HCV83409.1 3-deoxy-D-manno-octulosonic acid transferase [Zunongwangia profunda]